MELEAEAEADAVDRIVSVVDDRVAFLRQRARGRVHREELAEAEPEIPVLGEAPFRDETRHADHVRAVQEPVRRAVAVDAFVAGSIYADEVVLDNCVVIGGVFATQGIEMNNSIVGTFNTPTVSIDGTVQLLLPSAFSIEKMVVTPGAKLYNLSLADLGSLYKGMPQSPESGRVPLDVEADEVRTTLTNEEIQKSLRSYTIVGKVLAADLIDTDKFQNHFLLAAAALGPQLLKTYDLGPDKDGKTSVLSFDRLREFFFNLLNGTLVVQDMHGSFNISDITKKYK